MSARPNILLLYTDQQRFDTIAALGNPYIQTPALDSLVAEGVSFTSAYCPSPVCIASRCSLVLSQWPHQTGCVSNMPMPQEPTSLMELLHAAGYQTHGIGKMHFAPDRDKLWGFETRDFSEEGGMRATARRPHSGFGASATAQSPGDDFCDFLVEHGFDHLSDPSGLRSEFYYIPQPSQLPARLHNSHWVADRSLRFLRERDRGRPFFMWSSFIKPHPPFESPVPWNRLYKAVEMPFPHMPPGYEDLLTYWNRYQNRYKYRDQGFDWNLVRLIRAAYYAAISFVDYNVGRILAHLREEGDLDNTLVIFTSDHGELLGDFGSYGKRSILDPAARVPLLVRYPERFAAGELSEELASAVDVLPTCLAAAGIEASPEHVGEDLARLARGECDRDAVVSQYGRDDTGLYGLIGRECKYYYSAADNREWLVRRVPGELESRNLADHPGYADTATQMRERLIGWFREDGYEQPLDGDGWKASPRREIPSSPDAWQLFQEGRPVNDLFPPGYEPRCKPTGGLPVKHL